MNMDDRNYSLAVFVDYENLALGTGIKDAKGIFKRGPLPQMDLVLERLVERGRINVKRAYCDWQRFSSAVTPLHELGIELIEIPDRAYTGKNSADIRLAVDALEVCFTKEHLDTFVICSGDSDFSPLVAKLKEHGKRVIGLGMRQSTSALLANNCDEFIFYEDIALGAQIPQYKGIVDQHKEEAYRLLFNTIDALNRDNVERPQASLIKDTIKRKRPDFSETNFGYRNFTELLKEAESLGFIVMSFDDKSGNYRVNGFSANPPQYNKMKALALRNASPKTLSLKNMERSQRFERRPRRVAVDSQEDLKQQEEQALTVDSFNKEELAPVQASAQQLEKTDESSDKQAEPQVSQTRRRTLRSSQRQGSVRKRGFNKAVAKEQEQLLEEATQEQVSSLDLKQSSDLNLDSGSNPEQNAQDPQAQRSWNIEDLSPDERQSYEELSGLIKSDPILERLINRVVNAFDSQAFDDDDDDEDDDFADIKLDKKDDSGVDNKDEKKEEKKDDKKAPVAPVKRKRGRPRKVEKPEALKTVKHKAEEQKAEEKKAADAPSVAAKIEAAPEAPKRKRGRPRKTEKTSEQEAAVELNLAADSQGEAAPEAPKRKRGRPRKTDKPAAQQVIAQTSAESQQEKASAVQEKAEAPKRKRGRPRKSEQA